MKMRKSKNNGQEDKGKNREDESNAAPGPDGIRPAFLQQTKEEIVEPLRSIFEKSLEERKIPRTG